jgi:hypothetical protein
MTSLAERLRSELLPSSQLEELFFDTIVRLSTCASFLSQHIERDPDFINAETPRRMRLLLTTESKLRYAYEEFRRLKMARQLQLEDPAQAARPLLAVVATHTSRTGFRGLRRTAAPPQIPITTPVAPGRNAACPCNSGLKYKRCCANKQQVAA